MMRRVDDYRNINRANWDERAPAHAAAPDYDVQRFIDDRRSSAAWCSSTALCLVT